MLDLWKANAPQIDAIASDIYHTSPMNYRMILDRYTRPDNPLLIVETGQAIASRFFFYALADYSAIGFSPFGVDGGTLRPDMAAIGADFRVVGPAAAIITELQGTPRLKAAVEESGIRSRNLIFSNYDLLVRFPPRGPATGRPCSRRARRALRSDRPRLIAELGPDQFLVMGFDSAVSFRPGAGLGLHGGAVAQGRRRHVPERRLEDDPRGLDLARR